ncbi:16211_t:CDS:1, partial [Gigaspora margarita]
ERFMDRIILRQPLNPIPTTIVTTTIKTTTPALKTSTFIKTTKSKRISLC